MTTLTTLLLFTALPIQMTVCWDVTLFGVTFQRSTLHGGRRFCFVTHETWVTLIRLHGVTLWEMLGPTAGDFKYYLLTVCTVTKYYLLTVCTVTKYYLLTVCTVTKYYLLTVCTVIKYYLMTVCTVTKYYLLTVCTVTNFTCRKGKMKHKLSSP